jgi:hypothetical protein
MRTTPAELAGNGMPFSAAAVGALVQQCTVALRTARLDPWRLSGAHDFPTPMMMVHALSPTNWRLTIGALALTVAHSAVAIEVGYLRLERPAGKPLRAEIPLQDRQPIVAADLKARIAARETFEVAGLRYHPGLAKVQISARQLPNGKAALVLEGLPADAGTLDLLLTVSDRSMLTIAEFRVETQSLGNEFPPARAGSALAERQRVAPPAAPTLYAAPTAPTAPAVTVATAATAAKPPGVAPVATAAAASQAAAVPTDPRPALNAAVKAWAGAWSRRDVKAYLDTYSPNFVSPDRTLSFDAWAAQRRARIESRKDIDVRVEGLEFDPKGADWVASFTQHYRSGSFRETTRKQLLMRNIGGRWLIVAEREDS